MAITLKDLLSLTGPNVSTQVTPKVKGISPEQALKNWSKFKKENPKPVQDDMDMRELYYSERRRCKG